MEKSTGPVRVLMLNTNNNYPEIITLNLHVYAKFLAYIMNYIKKKKSEPTQKSNNCTTFCYMNQMWPQACDENIYILDHNQHSLKKNKSYQFHV